jgi:hypothetical protein
MDSLQKGTQNGDEASLKQLRSLLTAILLQHPVALVLHSVLQRIGEEKDAMILSVMVDGSASSKPGLVLLSEGMRKVSDVSSAGFPSCLLGMHKCLDALDQGLLPLDLLQCEPHDNEEAEPCTDHSISSCLIYRQYRQSNKYNKRRLAV